MNRQYQYFLSFYKKLSRKLNSTGLFVILIKFSKDLIQNKEEEKQAHNCQQDIDQCIFCFLEVFSLSSINYQLISCINNHQNNYGSTEICKELCNGQNKTSCLLSKILLRSDIIKEINNLETNQSCNDSTQICHQFFATSLFSRCRIHHLKSCPYNHHNRIKERACFKQRHNKEK